MCRKANSKCEVCGKENYRRPHEILKTPVYRCSICRESTYKVCLYCKVKFKSDKKSHQYCSRKCGNTKRRGSKYSKDSSGNKSKQRYNLLLNTFNIEKCMVEGCSYNTTLDIHRHIPGKEGGQYEIGNMFFICPNHHAEVTRNIIRLEKINDFTLRITLKR